MNGSTLGGGPARQLRDGLGTDRPVRCSSTIILNELHQPTYRQRISRTGHGPVAVAERDRNAGLPRSVSITSSGGSKAGLRPVACTAGWIAHALEACAGGGPLRPRAVCTGPPVIIGP